MLKYVKNLGIEWRKPYFVTEHQIYTRILGFDKVGYKARKVALGFEKK